MTTKTLELGTACIAAQGIWYVARPHMLALVGKTGESSSMSQLDGSDIVYMAPVRRWPKIIAISVHIGTRFPAPPRRRWATCCSPISRPRSSTPPSTPRRQSAIIPRVVLSRAELDEVLAEVRERGWAQADELLSIGIRSIAAPVRDRSGRTAAAMNVTVHAAETSSERLVGEYLPLLLERSRRGRRPIDGRTWRCCPTQP